MTERSGPSKDVPFSKRAIKANPIVQSRDAVKERRRDMFFKKVQQDRDDRRWANRGEQVRNCRFKLRKKTCILTERSDPSVRLFRDSETVGGREGTGSSKCRIRLG
jgi:hypothetical protein